MDELGLTFVRRDPALTGYVSSMFILNVGAGGMDDHFQPDWGVIGIALKGDWTWSATGGFGRKERLSFGTLFGSMPRAIRMTATPFSRVIGITLTPLGWAQLVGFPASTMMDKALPLETVFGEATELLEHLQVAQDDRSRIERLTRWLVGRIGLASAPDSNIAKLQTAIDDERVRSTADLAQQMGLTVPQLERICPGIFGFGPDHVLERQRFLRALSLLQQRSPGLSLQGFHPGYPDDEAFSRAFCRFMGETPASYLGSPRLLLKAAIRAHAAQEKRKS